MARAAGGVTSSRSRLRGRCISPAGRMPVRGSHLATTHCWGGLATSHGSTCTTRSRRYEASRRDALRRLDRDALHSRAKDALGAAGTEGFAPPASVCRSPSTRGSEASHPPSKPMVSPPREWGLLVRDDVANGFINPRGRDVGLRPSSPSNPTSVRASYARP